MLGTLGCRRFGGRCLKSSRCLRRTGGPADRGGPGRQTNPHVEAASAAVWTFPTPRALFTGLPGPRFRLACKFLRSGWFVPRGAALDGRGGTVKRALFLVVLVGLTGTAAADDDGYFCASNSYVAYELRGWSVPENEHVVRIIWVGGRKGIAEPIGLRLDDFQVHGMRCESDKVILFGWDKKYTIDLIGREDL